MTTAVILFFLLAGCCGALAARRKLAVMAMLSALISFEAVGSGFVPAILLENLQSGFAVENHPAWGERNAVIVLGAGTTRLPGDSVVKPSAFAYSRIIEAIRLYLLARKSNHQCSIVLSGGDASRTGVTEAEAYRTEMLQIGIEDSDILLERRSLNTFQNAEFTGALLRGKPFDRLFLVTSGLHLRRACLYFAHVGLYPTPCAADHIAPHVSILPAGYNFAIADAGLHEYAGLVRYYIYNFLGWNPPATRAGSP
ncbi:MAG: YdcF family protein [Verrucomicrobia bacterium]|nr:YdcF family protein [Verrucomicrobiota bacterium]